MYAFMRGLRPVREHLWALFAVLAFAYACWLIWLAFLRPAEVLPELPKMLPFMPEEAKQRVRQQAEIRRLRIRNMKAEHHDQLIVGLCITVCLAASSLLMYVLFRPHDPKRREESLPPQIGSVPCIV